MSQGARVANLFSAAAAYHAAGCTVIPVDAEKRPLCDWGHWRSRRQTETEVAALPWDRAFGVAILTWPAGDLLVIDFDGPHAEAAWRTTAILLPETSKNRTRSGGTHLIYNIPPGTPYPGQGNGTDIRRKVRLVKASCDCKAPDGTPKPCGVDLLLNGYFVAPPTPGYAEDPDHPFDPAARTVIPQEVLQLARQSEPRSSAQGPRTEDPSWFSEALRGVPQGTRDDTCTRLAGYLIGAGLNPAATEAILLESFARNCQPPLDAATVRKVVQSIHRKDAAGSSPDRVIEPKHISEVLTAWLKSVDAGPPDFLATPFSSLNRYLGGGFAPGELVYLGARAGRGKTSVALEVSRYAASRKTGVLIVSREMVNEALLRRIVSQDARIPALALKTGRLTEAEWRTFAGRHEGLKALPLWMTDEAVSLDEIVKLVERFTVRQPIGLLVVDYLQLVRASREIKDRRLQVEEVSSGLKTLAVRHRIPVLCISSLSRPFGEKKDEPPTLESLRESGELEYDADIVLFIHRKRRESATELILAKARDGREGVIRLMFVPECVAFEPASDEGSREATAPRRPYRDNGE